MESDRKKGGKSWWSLSCGVEKITEEKNRVRVKKFEPSNRYYVGKKMAAKIFLVGVRMTREFRVWILKGSKMSSTLSLP